MTDHDSSARESLERLKREMPSLKKLFESEKAKGMGELKRANYDAIRDHLFDRIHKTGEQIKNDFPNVLRTAIKEQAWKQFARADGTPFDNLVDWLHYQFPNGTSLGQGQHAITYEDALQLTEVAPDVHRVLAEKAPKVQSQGGRPSKNAASTQRLLERHNNGHSKAVLSVRLAQEHPKFYDAFMRGDYKSVTAAAVAAGLLKDDVRMRRAKSAYRTMTAPERKEFREWMESVELLKEAL
jgi:hypothetical protein